MNDIIGADDIAKKHPTAHRPTQKIRPEPRSEYKKMAPVMAQNVPYNIE